MLTEPVSSHRDLVNVRTDVHHKTMPHCQPGLPEPTDVHIQGRAYQIKGLSSLNVRYSLAKKLFLRECMDFLLEVEFAEVAKLRQFADPPHQSNSTIGGVEIT